MSQWTHANISIRADFIGLGTLIIEPTFRTFDYEDEIGKTDECNVPYGTEGSLSFGRTVIMETEHQLMATYSFSGDLRDYNMSDVETDMIPWLTKVTDGIMMVRQGFAQINVEFSDPIYLVYDEDDSVWKKL